MDSDDTLKERVSDLETEASRIVEIQNEMGSIQAHQSDIHHLIDDVAHILNEQRAETARVAAL